MAQNWIWSRKYLWAVNSFYLHPLNYVASLIITAAMQREVWLQTKRGAACCRAAALAILILWHHVTYNAMHYNGESGLTTSSMSFSSYSTSALASLTSSIRGCISQTPRMKGCYNASMHSYCLLYIRFYSFTANRHLAWSVGQRVIDVNILDKCAYNKINTLHIR